MINVLISAITRAPVVLATEGYLNRLYHAGNTIIKTINRFTIYGSYLDNLMFKFQ